ncbi:uncharacterized protein RHIMIDRAFT_251598 [Rhizopus microsporus ATCC 52813]|uniref:CCHC-type domain-containing protein n=1 Tax=Rhizopus microsporus ATCC 52813 TaxID=1340429 RepID=A0A2G4SV92_RHIZD|nr:uncharacterized protein RHIMIDRAFT_251598 [Rhizopus microsporus ATCC 52813]PHZ12662.1 hypothetical protein RHIMIDRAFT_251598 [Rhizopus microsporus ATCC 52813]
MACFYFMHNIYFISHNIFVLNLIADIEKCESCGQFGHKSKGSYKCSLYVNKKRKVGSKDDVGTKVEKRKGKKQRLEEVSSSKSNDQLQICKSCGQMGHKSARPKECSNYKEALDKALKMNLGTIMSALHARPEYKESFTEKIIILSAFIRNVFFRAQLFVNVYIVNNKDSIDLAVITQQSFWYAISQLIMGQKVTNKSYISSNVALGFEDIKAEHPSKTFKEKSYITRLSDLLSIIQCDIDVHCASIPPIVKSLAASPEKFVPTLAVMKPELEKLCIEHKDDKAKIPGRFSLMPTLPMHWRYISINAKALQAIAKHKSDGTYEGNANLFYSIFNFKRFDYESMDEVLASENKFTCCIQTDGFGECLAFVRKTKEEKATAQLGLEGFSDQEVKECF